MVVSGSEGLGGAGAAVLGSFTAGREKIPWKMLCQEQPALAGAAGPPDINGIFRLPIYVTWKVIYSARHRFAAVDKGRWARTCSGLGSLNAGVSEEPPQVLLCWWGWFEGRDPGQRNHFQVPEK